MNSIGEQKAVAINTFYNIDIIEELLPLQLWQALISYSSIFLTITRNKNAIF